MSAPDLTRPTRVLVVDDESVVRAFATRVLTDVGYAVDAVSGGPEALKVVEDEGPFDLFVIDVVMPEMRGDELARELRRRHPDARVLYVTGYADTLFEARNQLWENESFLEKPVTVEGFREAVSAALRGH